MDNNLEKIINDIVWWIPFKKCRNKLRNELISSINKLSLENKQTDRNISDEDRNELINSIIELTTPTNNIEYKKNIFKKYVQEFAIAISSFCNRTCWFCPNSFIDRHSTSYIMDENLFLNVLSQLKEIDYSNEIYPFLYNEPLADKELILKRMRQIKEYIPKSKIIIATNGDYLNREYLEDLEANGLDFMHITYYHNGQDKNIKYDLDNIVKPGMMKLINKLNVDYEEQKINEYYYLLKMKYKSLNFRYVAINWEEFGCDRGGTINGVTYVSERVKPCFVPIYKLATDYDGSFSLCCNIRADIKEHEKYIIGNVKEKSIFDLYMDEKMINFRRNLLLTKPKTGPCAHCTLDESWIKVFNI